jgi:hypothetical protein
MLQWDICHAENSTADSCNTEELAIVEKPKVAEEITTENTENEATLNAEQHKAKHRPVVSKCKQHKHAHRECVAEQDAPCKSNQTEAYSHQRANKCRNDIAEDTDKVAKLCSVDLWASIRIPIHHPSQGQGKPHRNSPKSWIAQLVSEGS